MLQADEQIEQQIKDKEAQNKVGPEGSLSKTEPNYFIGRAKTEEQKTALLKLQKDSSLGIGEWKRDSLNIIGELPTESRRLRLTEVREMVKEKKDLSSITDSFNKIAGAPDWEGGSGIDRKIYFLDDAHTEAIYVINGVNIVYVTNNKSEKQTSEMLFGDNGAFQPNPTQTPSSR